MRRRRTKGSWIIDRISGGLLVLVSVLAIPLLVLLLLSAEDLAGQTRMDVATVRWFAWTGFVLAPLDFLAGIGIFRSAKWGFYLLFLHAAVVLFGPMMQMLLANAVAESDLQRGLVLALFYISWALLRLSGIVGPPPR